MKADHVAFEVKDMNAAIEFYEKKLGLRLLSQQIDEKHKEIFAFLDISGCKLELIQNLTSPPPTKNHHLTDSLCPHFAIAVEDLDTTIQQLTNHGLKPVKGPLEIPNTVRWVYYADPDNNIIEFVQWLSS